MRAASGKARSRAMLMIPNSGPIASVAKAHSQPIRSTSGGIIQIVTIVNRNPRAV